MARSKAVIPAERIERTILLIRNQKVMLSTDLAELYGVEPRALVQAVKRNIERFPEDFMFQLNEDEFSDLKSQFVTSSWGGSRRAAPYAFTEQGVAMLSSVLRSKRAVQVNVEISVPSSVFAPCSPQTLSWPASSTPWRRSTICNSRRYSMPSAS